MKLYQGVTLGALSFPRDAAGNIIRGMKRHPTLEDDVVVYANATILGGDTVIGHHAVIGSNVWLTQSVAPYTVVSLEKPSLRIKGPTPHDFVPNSCDLILVGAATVRERDASRSLRSRLEPFFPSDP